MVKRFLAALSLFTIAALSGSVYAESPRTEGLNFELTPYVWAAGIDGELSVGNNEVDFERSFSDILDNTDAAFMGLAVISYDRFVLYADYDYLSLSADAKTKGGFLVPVGTKAQADTDLGVGTYGVGYRFDTFGDNTIDVLIGAQITDIEAEIKAGTAKIDNKTSMTDTVVMLRPSFQISERWRFNPTLAYGVSGDSDTTYTMMPQLQYQFADSFAARFGYKKLYYEFKENNNELDVSFSGPFLGVGWTFPERKEKVAATPPPAPAPVAKPAAPVVAAAPKDSDGDGVPDATDACPDTPKGTKVGPKGCPCDMSVQLQYKFDSAELTDQDKKTLDQVAVRLKELNWVGGQAAGYADNVGAADYNVKLSQRRAQSAVDYLATQGIAKDRFTVEGFGSAHPIADNSTAEGRAQNRRVVLRRTDCGKLEQ